MAQRGRRRPSGSAPGGRGSGRGSGQGDRTRRTRDGAPGNPRRPRSARPAPPAGGARPADPTGADEGTIIGSGRARPRRTQPSRQQRPQHTILGFSTGRALVLAVVVLMLALTLAVPLRTYLTQRSDAAQIAADQVQLEEDLRDLQRQKDQLNDPAYIEAQARQRLRFVKPGETPFQVQLPGDYQKPQAPEEQTKAAAGPWYHDLWHSISDPQPRPVAPLVPAQATEPGQAPAPVPAPQESGDPTG